MREYLLQWFLSVIDRGCQDSVHQRNVDVDGRGSCCSATWHPDREAVHRFYTQRPFQVMEHWSPD